jgi:hypothetical protein
VAPIISRQAVITLLVEKVLRKRTEAGGRKYLRNVVDKFRVGVSPTQQKTVREFPVYRELPGVVVRVAPIRADYYVAQRWIQPHTGIGVDRIVFLAGEEMFATGSDIRRRENKAPPVVPVEYRGSTDTYRIQSGGWTLYPT